MSSKLNRIPQLGLAALVAVTLVAATGTASASPAQLNALMLDAGSQTAWADIADARTDACAVLIERTMPNVIKSQ